MTDQDVLAERIRAAYESADLQAFGALLADDVRWGDDDHPNRCRGRADVMSTFERWLGTGVSAEVVDVRSGPHGVLCRLKVNWPDAAERQRGPDLIHVFLIRGDLIAEIRQYAEMPNAGAAIGAT